MPHNYKIVFIDWDGTLSVSQFWEHFKLTQQFAYALIQEHLFHPASDLPNKWMRGELTAEECVDLIAPKIGLPADALLAELATSCRSMKFIAPEVPRLVQELQKTGARAVIATDNMDTFPRWTVPGLRLLDWFDDVLDSHTLRALKRDRDSAGNSLFFDDYLRRTNIKPEECLLIDDSPQTVASVQEFGINTQLVKRGQGLIAALKSLA